MSSTSPPFPLLHLPYLPLYKVLSNFECEELIDLSICSRRCQLAVRLTKNKLTGMNACIGSQLFSFMVYSGRKLTSSWTSGLNECTESFFNVGLKGKSVKVRHYNNTLQFYPLPKDRKLIIKALIDHFSETFKIPITFVEFIANDFVDYLSFVPCISESEEIEFYGKTAISEKDQEYIKRTVKPKTKLSFYPRKDE